ncbi:MAG: hypothetical protein Q7N87_04015 [Candidatus Uhrbacteria bacterium]|nr:hypothetical protein [Candidatus Uhrbacteria bacterium]
MQMASADDPRVVLARQLFSRMAPGSLGYEIEAAYTASILQRNPPIPPRPEYAPAIKLALVDTRRFVDRMNGTLRVSNLCHALGIRFARDDGFFRSPQPDPFCDGGIHFVWAHDGQANLGSPLGFARWRIDRSSGEREANVALGLFLHAEYPEIVREHHGAHESAWGYAMDLPGSTTRDGLYVATIERGNDGWGHRIEERLDYRRFEPDDSRPQRVSGMVSYWLPEATLRP